MAEQQYDEYGNPIPTGPVTSQPWTPEQQEAIDQADPDFQNFEDLMDRYLARKNRQGAKLALQKQQAEQKRIVEEECKAAGIDPKQFAALFNQDPESGTQAFREGVRHVIKTVTAKKGKTGTAQKRQTQPRQSKAPVQSQIPSGAEVEREVIERMKAKTRPRLAQDGSLVPGRSLTEDDELELLDVSVMK